jgi:hypothetical protein
MALDAENLMTRRLLILLILTATAALGAPAVAGASRGQMVLFDTQGELVNPQSRAATLADLEELGVDALRVVVYWKDVAPSPDARRKPSFDASDPAAYRWGEFDNVLAEARARGWRVAMTLTTPAPKWATRDKDDYVTRPSAKEFGRFVTAAGKHWGEQVDIWAIGNEPNHPKFLLPQFTKKKGATSPGIYRSLFQAADRALDRTGNRRDTLLIGETLPRGTGSAVAPLTFLRGVLCLNSKWKKRKGCKKLDADGWSHHPYTTKVGVFFKPPGRNDVTIGVLPRLVKALDRAGRAGAIRKGLPVYLTEFGIQSTPDRYLGVSVKKQVEQRALAERMAWSTPRVKAFSQYLLRDDAPIPGVPARERYGRFESGLRFNTGHRKPSFAGFRLPLAALRKGSRVSLWGMVRPATGAVEVEIQRKDPKAKRFTKLKTVRTDSRGYLLTSTSLKKGRRYRLKWGDAVSPPVRVYKR